MTDLTSLVWGNVPEPITQGYGPGFAAGVAAGWYDYSADYGVPAGWHTALDIGVPEGTPIYARSTGVVEESGPNKYFAPEPVYVKTLSGAEEIYGHLRTDAPGIYPGKAVTPGTLLGYSGAMTAGPDPNSGDISGPHLHFELRVPCATSTSGMCTQDPTNYLQGTGPVDSAAIDTNTQTNTSNNGGLGELLPDFSSISQRLFLSIIGMIILSVSLWRITR